MTAVGVGLYVAASTAALAVVLSAAQWRSEEHRASPPKSRALSYLLALWFLSEAVALVALEWGSWYAGLLVLVWGSLGLVNGALWLLWSKEIVSGQLAAAQAKALQELLREVEPVLGALAEVEPRTSGLLRAAVAQDLEALGAAVGDYTRSRVGWEDLSRLPVVFFTADPVTGEVLVSRGRGVERYQLEPGQAEGTLMRDWPTPEAWRSVKKAASNQDMTTVQDLPGWIVPTRTAYAVARDGRILGLAVPEPSETDRALWEASSGDDPA